MVHCVHLDNSSDHATSQFLSVLSSFNLIQHVNFPTHSKNHTLDLVITFADSSLVPSLYTSLCSPSDHFPISLLSNLPLNLKSQRSFSTFLTNNLILILSQVLAWLLKKCASVLVPTITNIVNLSLSSGQFHPTLKQSTISPLLKKSNIDKNQGGYSLSSVARTPRLMSYDILRTDDTTYSRRVS